MKQFVFCLLFMLATTSAAFADNTSNTNATVREFADNMSDPGNVTDAIRTDCTCADALKATNPVQGNVIDHTPTINDSDCLRVQDGIVICDAIDEARIATALGLTYDQYLALDGCCIVILVGLDGEDLRVTVTNTDTGHSASFPVCK